MTTFDDILVAAAALGTGYVVSAVYENFANTGRGFATQQVGGPNKHLCSGKCKAGSCDSQSFCVDSGCGSVIRGGDECIVQKPTSKPKPKPNSPRIEKKEPIHPNRPKKTTPGSLGPIQGPDVSQIPGGGGGDQTSIAPAPGLTDNTDQEQPFPNLIQPVQGQEEFPTRKPQREVPSTMPPSPPPGRAPPPDVGAVTPPSDGQVFYPYHPRVDGGKQLPNGCEIVKLSHGGSTWSCRWQAKTDEMIAHGLKDQSYRIDAVLDLGDKYSDSNQELSITAGGPGSTDANCCGFTARINIKDGTLQMESEDWSQHASGGGTTGATYCRGASCTDGPLKSISNGKALYNTKNIGISLIVMRSGNDASYTMIATGPAGTITSKTFKNPPSHKGNTGPAIIPYHFIHPGTLTNDGDRIRVDSCKTVNFHGGPKVTVLARGSYYGELGYIESNDV